MRCPPFALTEPDDRAWAERVRTYEQHFAADQALLRVARIEGRCVGYAFTVLHPGSDDAFPLGAGYAELYTLAVLPEARGLGIGTASTRSTRLWRTLRSRI